eukprot:3193630-Prymnesium_polylepis.1
MKEASSAGHMLLLHYNWKYIFISPTAEVCARYLAKHGQGGARRPQPPQPSPHPTGRSPRPRPRRVRKS